MPQGQKSRASSKMIARAREFRHGMTPAEELLWSRLQNRGLGVKFRRHHPIGRFIVDFYCDEARLVVELDSEAHAMPREAEQDRERDAWLEERVYRLLRFQGRKIDKVVAAVVQGLGDVCDARRRLGSVRACANEVRAVFRKHSER